MELHRFAFKVDLFYQSVKLSKKIVEVPIAFGTRKQEASKFSLKEMVATYKVVLLLRFNASQRFIKFGLVGFLGFVVNAVGLVVFAKLGFTEALTWLLATEVAIISNFTWNNLWTFQDKIISGFGNLLKKFVQFNITSAGALVIQTVVGTILTGILGPQYRILILFFAVVFLVLPYNYFMYTAVIWRKKK
jgi:dolichol-phosphate mannosyltransferase